MLRKIKDWMVVMLLMGCFILNVHADMIVGPENDDFYQNHQREIYSLVRLFQADKDIDVVKSPDSDEVLTVLQKGKVIRVDFTYKDAEGKLWGMQKMEDDTGAWFEMEFMSHHKDQHDFWDEHPNMKSSNEIIQFNQKGYLILWEYPNSNMIASAPPTSILDREIPIKGGVEYIDENGTRWVRVGIDFRTYLGWLNMDEPVSKRYPDSVGFSIDLNGNETQIQHPYDQSMLISTLVIGVCILTGVLTWVKKKQKK
ncbi:MAG: hypothetical protein E7192_02620 [Erysipelotrichaceae bacterium]|nr:hypothetical protein [Erysipelotrichaceae bacterium]